jgi:hypothetical protein
MLQDCIAHLLLECVAACGLVFLLLVCLLLRDRRLIVTLIVAVTLVVTSASSSSSSSSSVADDLALLLTGEVSRLDDSVLRLLEERVVRGKVGSGCCCCRCAIQC